LSRSNCAWFRYAASFASSVSNLTIFVCSSERTNDDEEECSPAFVADFEEAFEDDEARSFFPPFVFLPVVSELFFFFPVLLLLDDDDDVAAGMSCRERLSNNRQSIDWV